MSIYITNSVEETEKLAFDMAQILKSGSLIAFTGGLGSGKTAFCRGLAKGLGCIDDVSSPTFAIVNVYRGPQVFAHFDMYRINTEQDLLTAGFYDYLEDGAIVAAEWSENVCQFFDEPIIHIDIKKLDEDKREFNIYGKDFSF